MEMSDIFSAEYSEVKKGLTIRAYDSERDVKKLENLVHSDFGDLSAGYAIIVNENDTEKLTYVLVSPELLEEYGVTKNELHEDAMWADINRGVLLYTISDILTSLESDDKKMPNYFIDPIPEEAFHASEDSSVLFCLTNENYMCGAGLIFNRYIMDQIAKQFGCNFYVLPSSVHECLLIPEKSLLDKDCIGEKLEEIVTAINSELLDADTVLSDKVQYYDAASGKLINARQHEGEQNDSTGILQGVS